MFLSHREPCEPLSVDEFAEAMAATGPYETAPMLAVAVSGGADSMALCLLAERWARDRGGQIVALSVDHGLRQTSAAEVRQVARWMKAHGIEHEVLVWQGDKPATGIQARARAARYRLLAERCLERGLLHLLVGHHCRDQAETVMLRRSRGSGSDGLAAMARVVETGAVRIVRPLLGVPPERLRALLAARGQPWVDDPANADRRFARSRMRAALLDPSAGAPSPEELAQLASQNARERDRRATAVAVLLARCCRLHPAGFATVDANALLAAPPWAAVAALGRVLATIGGGDRPPSLGKLDRLRRSLGAAGSLGGSLGRCRYWWLDRSESYAGGGSGGPASASMLAVCRESRALPLPMDLAAATTTLWDGRFRIDCAARCRSDLRSGIRLCALGEDGWRDALGIDPTLRGGPVPRQAALALPAFCDDGGLLAVPTLGVRRSPLPLARSPRVSVVFAPRRSLSGTSYFLA